MLFSFVVESQSNFGFTEMVLAQFLVESLQRNLGPYKYAVFTSDDISSAELGESDAVVAFIETADGTDKIVSAEKLYTRFRKAHPEMHLIFIPACPHYDNVTIGLVEDLISGDPNTTLFLFDGIGSGNLDRLIDELAEIAD